MADCILAVGIGNAGRLLDPCFPVSGVSLRPRLAMRTFRQKSRGLRTRSSLIAKCESGSSSDKPAFGYTRKDVLLIGVGVMVLGVGLKYGLEYFGLDSLKAGNVVQLVMVLGLTVGWIFSYVYRVSNKDMTYAKQLKDYELKVMEKRFQELPEAELETLLAQVEEEKERMKKRESN